MKLYTEEQVREAFDNGYKYASNLRPTSIGEHHKYVENSIKSLTPIELPSDVEVGKIVLGNSPIMEHRDSGYFAAGAMEYNKWLKEQILNQNK